MKNKIKFVSALVIALGIHSAAFANPLTAQDKADATNINTACVQDAATAGCSGEVVGKGLLKCLRNYKKANASFKFTPGCQAALKEFREDRKAGK